MFLWLLKTIIGEEGRFYLHICSTVRQPSSKLGQDPKTAFYFRACPWDDTLDVQSLHEEPQSAEIDKVFQVDSGL